MIWYQKVDKTDRSGLQSVFQFLECYEMHFYFVYNTSIYLRLSEPQINNIL